MSGLMDVLVDLKGEVESYTGKKINIGKQLKNVEKSLKKQGKSFQKNDLKKISAHIKQPEKRQKHKARHLQTCIESGIEYSPEIEDLEYQSSFNFQNIARNAQAQGGQEDLSDMPVKLTIGVTIALCGFFLYLLPIPMCQVWAKEIVVLGVGIAIDGCAGRQEENKKR